MKKVTFRRYVSIKISLSEHQDITEERHLKVTDLWLDARANIGHAQLQIRAAVHDCPFLH
jgi:hypothetical protein